ncbi:MAG: hypothetical protein WBI25_05290, partial [Smithellaceae bacterium]
GSTVSFFMAKVLIKFILQKFAIFEDCPFDLSYVLWGNTFVSCQSDRIKPEFTFTSWSLYVDVRRFVPFIRVKMISE